MVSTQGCQLFLFYWGLRNLLIYLKLSLLGSGVYMSVLFSFFKNDSIFFMAEEEILKLEKYEDK